MIGAGTLLAIASGVLVLVGLAGLWQEGRYLRTRRRVVQDRQPLFHGAKTFHVVTLAKMPAGADLFGSARALIPALESKSARVIYIGKGLGVGIESKQLRSDPFDFALLCQYSSREDYERTRALPEVSDALSRFEWTYDQGMHRSAYFNLALPLILLGRRLLDLLKRTPARYPFQRGGVSDELAHEDESRRAEFAERLRKEQQLGADAVLVVNFIKRGTKEQRAKDAAYGGAMLGLMAEQGHGPMHMGRAVCVEGDASFETVALVYYPGVEYFAQMVESTFFGGIVGGKQLGDTLSTVTVPFLNLL